MAGSIDIQHLCVRRGDFELTDVSLHVEPREIYAILGRTGSGKTVLFETIAGAFAPTSGRVLLNGKDAAGLPPQRRNLGIVYQDYALFPHLTVFENVAYGLRRNGVAREELRPRVMGMLEMFGIEHLAERHPGVISGGESQRAALARALVLRPEILLLDEPFAALDPATKERLYEMLRQVHARFDCTIVFVTHDFNEAQTLADRIGVLIDGRLLAQTDAKELFVRSFDDEVMRFLGRS